MSHPPAHQSDHENLASESIQHLNSIKWFFIITLISAGVILGISSATYGLSQNKLPFNTRIAGFNVGLMDTVEATQFLQSKFDAMIDAGVSVELDNKLSHINLTPNAATDPDLVYQLLDWDVAKSVKTAKQLSQSSNQILNFFTPVYRTVINPIKLQPEITLAETRFAAALHEDFAEVEALGQPTDFVFSNNNGQLTATVTAAVPGAILDTSHAAQKLIADAQDLRLDTLQLKLVQSEAIVDEDTATSLIPEALQAVENAPYTLTFTPEYGADLHYTLSTEDLKNWLLPGWVDSQPSLALDAQAMENFLQTIHTDVDVAPQDASMTIEDNRVTNFAPSRDGFIMNDDKLLKDIVAILGTDIPEVKIATERTAAQIPTEQANDLGIKEVLGVGLSNFSGSPANRRANIKHGAAKLNGLLVPPGETLSLLEKLKPFTLEDGYLSELVIKGDEIIPEVGGGLCQIGTTTFRAAMNSGLNIAERRNHSLVVSYYNDLTNGNPGTDATIYDPAPDLKILNDTENYILLITEVDEANSQLRFTFWGSSDGRVGSYTPPQVLKWIPAGEPVTKITDALAPGKKSCQSAHPGATTTFDYNITLSDGQVTTQTFLSNYRPLPTICLVGAEPKAPDTGQETQNSTSDTSTTDESDTLNNEDLLDVLNEG